MGGAISGSGAAVSSIIGGIGQKKALKQQQKATDKQMDYQKELAERQEGWLSPFREAGTDALAGLSATAGKPIDREATLKDYYAGDEYAMDSEQARRQQLAASAATGGLGSSSTNNALASIAPQLGQNYLSMKTAEQQDMYNQLLGLTNVGLSGAGAQSAAATGTTNALTALAGQKGNILAQRASLPYNVAATANNQMAQGAAQDVNKFADMFGGMMGGMMGGV